LVFVELDQHNKLTLVFLTLLMLEPQCAVRSCETEEAARHYTARAVSPQAHSCPFRLSFHCQPLRHARANRQTCCFHPHCCKCPGWENL